MAKYRIVSSIPIQGMSNEQHLAEIIIEADSECHNNEIIEFIKKGKSISVIPWRNVFYLSVLD